jgi:hypothetical protein
LLGRLLAGSSARSFFIWSVAACWCKHELLFLVAVQEANELLSWSLFFVNFQIFGESK